ncbi:MAG: PadR family transcriptional regulator [Parcubacteria group bacterium]|nr:MAG: PadR family transcriptional regulator [Parcubacteria group bacterium]
MLPFERLQNLNTKENLWVYILSLLKKGPVYAWEIQAIIEKNFGFKPGRITPYRALYRLEEDGFVKSVMEERRRVYKITQKGEEEIKKAKKFYRTMIDQLND